jgi:6-phospho-3-hexuloisomerase
MAEALLPPARAGCPPDPAIHAISSRARQVTEEVRRAVGAVDPAAAAALLAAAGAARRVFFDAQGRSGLVARAIAMRWMHLGVTSYVTGETITPAIGDSDLLVCLSASGRTSTTLAHAATARDVGARIAALTATASSPLAGTADLVVLIPARAGVATAQHAGSLFEQACLVLGDVICGVFAEQHAIPDRQLGLMHANLL